ncbi:TetR/AcrR family transcriptional regulator [Dietzia sp. B32]|uniref:TetR/AcrR family transcriptional regulator n=1 Tax=Dietzia sp. B32 TaxID=2915130 RepID=UPI0021AD9FA5|nr:TetR/AcrR family transcriptional regulator [Dietzia sp. B32]UVE95683.1 TetR/AcrR family transcriptional regulator [Dietzia sp. B32]
MDSPPDPHSLRDRKRRATMVAIENAATALVLENGYDAVTVDQICAAAEVSKRTFFNYVPSKEAAVIGTTPEDVPESSRADFLDRPDRDVLDALLRLYLAAFAATRTADKDQTATLAQRRRAIFRAEPELAAARMTASSRFQLRLADLVTTHLDRHPSLRRLVGATVEAEARACVALVAATANLGLSAWLTRDSATFDDLDDDCATALRQLALLVSAPHTPAPTTPHPAGSPA